MYYEIDCVILWVDGSDKEWKKKKDIYSKEFVEFQQDIGDERFRDWGTLRFLYRGLAKFAPWFRKIFLVTDGQIPSWLNVDDEKIYVIDHKEFIPKEFLPTFNSHTIEMNLHRIEGLSEYFVYFNDDMFLLKKVEPQLFFKNRLPCDSAIMNAFAIKKTNKPFRFLMPINNIAIINDNFDKQRVLKKFRWKFFNIKYGKEVLRTLCLTPWRHFTGFTINHMPYSICKKTLENVWQKENDILKRTCMHKFRDSNDVNIWLIQYWQYAEGNFYPRSLKHGKLLAITDNLEETKKICNIIREQKCEMCCINDEVNDYNNFEKIKSMLIETFVSILPEKSRFEL